MKLHCDGRMALIFDSFRTRTLGLTYILRIAYIFFENRLLLQRALKQQSYTTGVLEYHSGIYQQFAQWTQNDMSRTNTVRT